MKEIRDDLAPNDGSSIIDSKESSSMLISVTEEIVEAACACGLLGGSSLDGSNEEEEDEDEDEALLFGSKPRIIRFQNPYVSNRNQDEIRDAAIRNLSLSMSTLTHFTDYKELETSYELSKQQIDSPIILRGGKRRITRPWAIPGILLFSAIGIWKNEFLKPVSLFWPNVTRHPSRPTRAYNRVIFLFSDNKQQFTTHSNKRRRTNVLDESLENTLMYLPGNGICSLENDFNHIWHEMDCTNLYSQSVWHPDLEPTGLVSFYKGRRDLSSHVFNDCPLQNVIQRLKSGLIAEFTFWSTQLKRIFDFQAHLDSILQQWWASITGVRRHWK